MDINNFFLIFIIFIALFVFFKKSSLLIDNITYSDHKIIGSENSKPIMIGGVYILLIHLIFNFNHSLFLSISAILITLLGFMSDKNILPSPNKRLILQFLIILLVSFFENLEINDVKFEIFNIFLNNTHFNLIFTVFCMAILINGSNFLDGLNGLLSGYYLMILVSIIFIESLNYEIDVLDIDFIIIIFLALLIFFVFNIFGLVYLGDSGTYLLSLIIGFYLIKFNYYNDIVSPYYIALLLWYPAFENLFSLLRRVIKKKSASSADNLHLHQLFFLFLKSKNLFSKKKINSFSGAFILLWNFPGFLIANNFPTKSLPLLIMIFINIIVYIFLYYFFSKKLIFKK